MNAMIILVDEIVNSSRAYFAQPAAPDAPDWPTQPAKTPEFEPAHSLQAPGPFSGSVATISARGPESHGIRELNSPLSE